MRLTDPRHQAFWRKAERAAGNLQLARLKDIGCFDDHPEGAKFCADAVLAGTKTATSAHAGTARDYRAGDLEIVTLFDGQPVAVIEIINVDRRTFGEIDEDFAIAEGDGSLAKWRETHTRYYGGLLAERGKALDAETPLVRIFFRKIFPV
ncbi:MAG: ASCH domain-containing protein [Pseudomonadota bacterium]